MSNEDETNILCETIIRANGSGAMVDGNGISWRVVNGEWIGKRSVYTFDFRSCWLENTTKDNIKSWWHGDKEADYNEIFIRKIKQ